MLRLAGETRLSGNDRCQREVEALDHVSNVFDTGPFGEAEIMEYFHDSSHITAKHLLTIYSIAVGMNAKTMLDLGLGATTRALRLAARRTGGILWSCDCDVKRFSSLLQSQDEQWHLFLGSSEAFIESVEAPFDFVMHDAAHDYYQVKLDLTCILRKMRTFGIICVHDTQQVDLGHELLAAIRDATRSWQVSFVNLPYSGGLGIIRVESGEYPATRPGGIVLADGRPATDPVACPLRFCEEDGRTFERADTSFRRWVRWRLRKLVKGW